MDGAKQKHPCPDCRYCQWCGDDRCRLCRHTAAGTGRKLSMAEQILRFEEVNRHGPGTPAPRRRAPK